MPSSLRELVAPHTTAVLTMELQRGVVGDLSPIAELSQAVEEAGVLDHAARLLRGARDCHVSVVHCTAEFRPDRAGSAANSPMLSVMARHPGHLLVGSEVAEVMPMLGPEPSDLVSARLHGVSPFTGTELDAMLRNLGTKTVIATGVSINLGIVGLAIEAVNLGYRVVVATDAVAGTPKEYAEAVTRNTLALVATRATVSEILAVWGATPPEELL